MLDQINKTLKHIKYLLEEDLYCGERVLYEIKNAIDLIEQADQKREECEQALINTIKYESNSVYFWDPSDVHLFEGGERLWQKHAYWEFYEEYHDGEEVKKRKQVEFLLADKFDMRTLSDSVVDVILGKNNKK